MNYEEILKNEWDKYKNNSENKCPNILVLGKTGCGKSSLINNVFQKEIAPVSNVKPETQNFIMYKGKDYGGFVNLIDSKGYEMSQGDDVINEYKKVISNEINICRKKNININVVWFCISVAGERIEDIDLEILKYINNIDVLRKKVCVVLTKCDEDEEDGSIAKKFIKIIHNSVDLYIKIFQVSNDESLREILDLKKLVEESANMIDDEEMKRNFIGTQMIDIESKKKEANKVIVACSAGAAAVGATPIPFSDATLLVPDQLIMITKIISIYNMQNLKGVSTSLVSDMIITQLGKTVVSSIIKLIPGVGTIIGGIINASVATMITAALGKAISEICYKTSKKILTNEYVDYDNIFDPDDIKDLFYKFYKKRDD